MNARFRFWLITCCAVLSVAITLSLGRWQLSRAAQKESLQFSIASQTALPTLDGSLASPKLDLASSLHRRVILRGQWLPAHTVFLDNRQMNSKVGLYVVTPLKLEGDLSVVLVQRGWVARNFMDRESVPQVETPKGIVEIQGRIAPPPSKLYEMGSPTRGLIRQNLDVASFGAETGLSLLPFSIQQTGPGTEGLLREWPVVSSGVEKHYGYAFQWFALSGLIAILYVWFQIVRRIIISRRA